MGGLAAFVTFREKLRPVEKAAWIVLITLLIVAEIRNIYVSDAEQIERFGKISDSLTETKRGLDTTAIGITATAKTLDKVMEKSSRIFGGVKENLRAVTGEGTFVEFGVVPNMGSGNPPEYPVIVWVWGKYPVRSLTAVIQLTSEKRDPDSLKKEWESRHAFSLGDGTLLPGPHILSERLTLGTYGIAIASMDGISNESLELKLNGKGELAESHEVWKNGTIVVKVKDGKLMARQRP